MRVEHFAVAEGWRLDICFILLGSAINLLAHRVTRDTVPRFHKAGDLVTPNLAEYHVVN